MNEYVVYYTECRWCGKRAGGTVRRLKNSGPPSQLPYGMSGTCTSSPDKKHKPRWSKD